MLEVFLIYFFASRILLFYGQSPWYLPFNIEKLHHYASHHLGPKRIAERRLMETAISNLEHFLSGQQVNVSTAETPYRFRLGIAG